jgi:2-polyprenyl-6-methoxyphenol hydroxylase-like FAD-dependent oxidoreductase
MAWILASRRPDHDRMTSSGRAVIIGASIGGLLAARALSDTFDRVTVLDRDHLPDGPAARRGVPQGRHLHGLLASGTAILEELFPGFTGDMISRGAVRIDLQSDIHWYNDGHLLHPGPSGIYGLAASRPLIEDVIRYRVLGLPGVEIIDSCEAAGLVPAGRNGAVTGVTIVPRSDGAASSVIGADLVVDASGRGSRSPVWLAGLGYPVPAEEHIAVNVTYVSRLYRREPHQLGGRAGTAAPAFPGSPNAAMVLAQEDGTFILATYGIAGAEPPMDDGGLRGFAAQLATTDITEFLGSATRISEPVKMRYPRSTRRRYEQVARFPAGYLVFGDAICTFNPVYGQGMSVAAAQAQLLAGLVADGQEKLAERFFAAAAELVDTPWAIASGADLRFGEVEGPRSPETELMHSYLSQLYPVAARDQQVATAFMKVINLLEPPSSLLEPEVARRVLGDAA